jgi:peptidylprolyl isomerase
MQVGGRRLLVIPAELGYGDNPPQGSGIEAGETLIFVVDLVSFE